MTGRRGGATVGEMLAHLDQLAIDLGALISFWDGSPETPARLVLTGTPTVYIKPLRDRRQYFDGLHELGHLAVGVLGRPREGGLLPVHLVEEVFAWDWALSTALIAASPTVTRGIVGCLQRYSQDVFIARHGGDPTIPSEATRAAMSAWSADPYACGVVSSAHPDVSFAYRLAVREIQDLYEAAQSSTPQADDSPAWTRKPGK
jgi:hypothetical protein